jgi:glutathione S-transferase
MARWALWAVTELENNTLSLAQNGEKPETLEALKTPFAVLEKALAKTGWLVGGRFTVADVNVAEIVRYAATAKSLFDAHPNVKKWYAACIHRPAYRQMWEARNKEPA